MTIERKPLPGDLKKEPTLESDYGFDISDVEVKEDTITRPPKSMRVLGWEISARRATPAAPDSIPTSRRGRFAGFSANLDRAIPPNRRYLGRSRRTFLLVVGIILLLLLGLVIGLAVGLTIGKRGYALHFLDSPISF